MTNLTVNDPWKSIHKTSLIGFDELFERIKELDKPQAGFPPYNIVKTADSVFKIVMAVAGFSKEDISVVLEDSRLTISGSFGLKVNDPAEYIYKGIAERNFKRVFTLSDSVEVGKVTLSNGMLEVTLNQFIPEHKKPKIFDIVQQ
jgi:molecular chaperone IbpA